MPENNMLRPLDLPPMGIVQTTASAEQLSRMIARVEAAFSDVQYASSFRDQGDESFIRGGWEQFNLLDTALARSEILRSRFKCCFELGCGYGRATQILSDLFPRVIAADISAPHLNATKEYTERLGRRNIIFMHVNKLDSLRDLPSFDLFFSRFVLQHDPPPIQRYILNLVLSKLDPGGMGYFQMAVYNPRYSFDVAEYLATEPDHRIPEMHIFPQPELFKLLAQHDCRPIDIREDSSAGPTAISFHLLIEKNDPTKVTEY